jgi:hypothetical protein
LRISSYIGRIFPLLFFHFLIPFVPRQNLLSEASRRRQAWVSWRVTLSLMLPYKINQYSHVKATIMIINKFRFRGLLMVVQDFQNQSTLLAISDSLSVSANSVWLVTPRV